MDFRRIGLLVVAVVVAAVCVRLGIWQLDRLQERRAANELVRAGLEQPAAPLGELLVGAAPVELAWRHAEVSGTYDPAEEVILYGRTQAGRSGDHVLTPLVLADGTAVVVDRGWIPFDPDRGPPITGPAAAPGGRVTVAGVVLAPGSGAVAADPSVRGETDPVTMVQQVDLGVLQRQVPYPLAPVALQLQEQRPAQAGGLPEPATLPELDEGPHLSYAIQWFAFATIAVVGYVLLLRRDRRARDEAPVGGGVG